MERQVAPINRPSRLFLHFYRSEPFGYNAGTPLSFYLFVPFPPVPVPDCLHPQPVRLRQSSVCLSVQDFTFKSAWILIVRAKTGIFKTVFGDVKPLCELGYFFCLSVWKYLFTYILSLFVLYQSATLPACCLMSATAVLLVPLIPCLANLWNLCEMPLFVIKR